MKYLGDVDNNVDHLESIAPRDRVLGLLGSWTSSSFSFYVNFPHNSGGV